MVGLALLLVSIAQGRALGETKHIEDSLEDDLHALKDNLLDDAKFPTADLERSVDTRPLTWGDLERDSAGSSLKDLDAMDLEAKKVARDHTGRPEFSTLEPISQSHMVDRQGSEGQGRGYLNGHMLPQIIDVPKRYPGRKVLLDCGGGKYGSSVKWFTTRYGVDFDHIYVWEVKPGKFKVPKEDREFMKDKLTLYDHTFVGVQDLEAKPRGDGHLGAKTMGLPKWLAEQKFTSKDFVVMKMDVEGSEYELLNAIRPHWPQLSELFVEIHFKHPKMRKHGWDFFKEHSIQDAEKLLLDMRKSGVYAHYWP